MNILDKITADKKLEVEAKKKSLPLADLEKELNLSEKTRSLKEFLLHSSFPGVIAEIKRRSPSRGVLKQTLDVPALASGYMQAGAAALSVLTDEKYFSGTLADLRAAREAVSIPVLRKDFLIDEYQVTEARVAGADIILLIARILTPARARELAALARDLGMEILLEVHNERELEEHLHSGIDLVGVNNRNLDTLEMNIALSLKLAPLIPEGFVKISESGISSIETIVKLANAGFNGFLIGESFMAGDDPAEKCAALVKEIGAQCQKA